MTPPTAETPDPTDQPQALTGWYRITYPAALDDGTTKTVRVILRNPTIRPSAKHEDVEIISGTEVTAEADLTDRVHVIMATPGEAKIVRLVQDLITERLVTPERESPESRAMRSS